MSWSYPSLRDSLNDLSKLTYCYPCLVTECNNETCLDLRGNLNFVEVNDFSSSEDRTTKISSIVDEADDLIWKLAQDHWENRRFSETIFKKLCFNEIYSKDESF